jgi:hypothetical protein
MRLALVTGWILLGAAMTGALYWAFLNTPESTVFALVAAAALMLITLASLSMTINGAMALWTDGPSREVFARSFRTIPAVLPALLVFAMFWLIAHRMDTWVALRSGEINAWFIATFGWDDMAWLFTAVKFFTLWLRWVVGGLLAVSLMGGIRMTGPRAVLRARWLVRGVRPRTLLAGTAWFVALIALPWAYLVPWRPGWIPPTGAELAFIAIKLSLAAVLMAIGMSLMLYEVARLTNPERDNSLRSW